MPGLPSRLPALSPRQSRDNYYNAIKHIMQSYGIPVEEGLKYAEEEAPQPYWGRYKAPSKLGQILGGQSGTMHLAPGVWQENVGASSPHGNRDVLAAVVVHEMGHSSRRDRAQANHRRGIMQEAKAEAIEQLLTPLVQRNIPGQPRPGADFARVMRDSSYRKSFGPLIDQQVELLRQKLGARLYPGAH